MKSGNKQRQQSFYYITDPLLETVKDSQVINWLELLGIHQIIFHLIIPTSFLYYLNKYTLRKKKLKEAAKKIKGRIIEIPIIRKRSINRISGIFLTTSLFVIFAIDLIKGKTILIQTRNFSNINTLTVLKHILKKIRIIYEMRGASAEEYINLNGYNKISDVVDNSIIRQYSVLLKSQFSMINLSEKTICVSGKLKDYIIEKNNNIDKNKLTIIPGAADKNMFFFNTNIRNNLREKLKVENKFIIVYTGKLDRSWHKPEFIFKFIKELLKPIPELFFFCITPDIKLAEKLADKNGLNNFQIYYKYEPYEKIQPYLCAADLGLLIRDDIPTNHVASPTKLPEYLLCGLPVIISQKIGDFSDFIERNNLGLVVNNDMDAMVNNLKTKLLINKWDRIKISEIAEKYLSKQSWIKDLIRVYSHV